MKRALIVGKFNPVVEEVKNIVSKVCQVQTTLDHKSIIKGILTMNRPDIVIFVFAAMEMEIDDLVKDIKADYPDMAVLCIGNEADYKSVETYLETKQFSFLMQPVETKKMLEVLCGVLSINPNDIELEKKSSASRKLILLIDDSPVMLRTVSNILEKKFEVLVATSGMQAMTILGRRKPDMIFLDYEMPVCDGQMTLRMIREVEEIKDIPVVFLTGVQDREHISAVMDLHPAGYLLKPAPADKIIETANKVLNITE